MWPFSYFQYGFSSSESTADLLTIKPDRIARAFKTVLGLLGLQHLIYPRLLIEFGMLVFFINLSLVEFQVRYLTLWSSSSLHGPELFLLYIDDLPDDVICNIAVCGNDTTLYSKSNQGSDLWQQLELASELESDLRDTVDWYRKWFVDFNSGKTQLVLFGRCNKTS